MKRLPIALAALGIVLLHGALLSLGAERRLAGDERAYARRAAQLLQEGSVDDPFLLWPPLQHHFLAWIARATGAPPDATTPIHVVQILLLFAAAVLLYDLARKFGASERAAATSAFFLVGYPSLAAYAGYLWPEILHLFLFVAALWLLIARRGAGSAAGAGVLLGLALLAKSVLQPFIFLLLAVLLLRGERRRAVLVAALCGLVVLPTIVRHQREHGRPVIADSGLFNVWVGLHDESRKSLRDPIVWPMLKEYRASAPTATERREWLQERIAQTVEERGVVRIAIDQATRQPFRFFDKDSYFTDMLPGGDLNRGAGYDDLHPYFNVLLRAISYSMYAALLVLAAFGAWTARPPPEMRAWHRWMIAFVLGYLTLFLVLHVKSRYRVQIFPVAAIWAGLAVDALRVRHEQPLGRIVGGGATAALLLFWAFGSWA